MADWIIIAVSLFLSLSNLVVCEVRKDEIYLETGNNCSIQDLSSISNVNTSIVSQKYSEDQLHNSTFSYSCPSNDSTRLCVFSDDDLSKCGDIPYDILQCSSQGNISVLACYCITYNENDKESQAEIGSCMYNCFKTNSIYSVYHNNMLPENNSDSNKVMCEKEFSRNGTLCGKCKNGYHPLVYSYNLTCVKCPRGRANWWKFVHFAFLPLTIFYFIVVFYHFFTPPWFYLLQSSHFYACNGTVYHYRFEALPKVSESCQVY